MIPSENLVAEVYMNIFLLCFYSNQDKCFLEMLLMCKLQIEPHSKTSSASQ